MATLLAKKSGDQDFAIAKDDEHHEALSADPTIAAFPSSGTGVNNAFSTPSSGSSAFGATPAAGFGSPTTGFGAAAPAATGFGSSPATGAGSFGSPAAGGQSTGSVQVVQNQSESLKSGGGAMSQGGESTVALDQGATDWINKKMRPMMGWIYMLTCTCDFVIFPVLWSLLQALSKGQVTSQWQPLTLQGAGLYHIAMGAVLGIAAYGRTKEKVAGVA